MGAKNCSEATKGAPKAIALSKIRFLSVLNGVTILEVAKTFGRYFWRVWMPISLLSPPSAYAIFIKPQTILGTPYRE